MSSVQEVVLSLPSMKRLPKKLKEKLAARSSSNALRALTQDLDGVDFSSNDYLGFARSKELYEQSHQFVIENGWEQNGATGSRLLSGNHALNTLVETQLCTVFKAEAALVFNSGYSANIGFFSSVPQRGDLIYYDEFIHASIRDGIALSHARSYKFKHNDLADLEDKFRRNTQNGVVYCVTESVFSMDGDSPDITSLVQLCERFGVALVIDEAHALGVVGDQGHGLVSDLGLEQQIFARIHTFGKALGCHGAAILGSKELKNYLVNFSRSFIYTTALPPHALSTIHCSLNCMIEAMGAIQMEKLSKNIAHFKSEIERLKLNFIPSNSAIQSCVLHGNDRVKAVAEILLKEGFNVKPILAPTVPKNQERLRFCLHSYNSTDEITNVLEKLATFVHL